MDPWLSYAIIFITLALVFYSIGVWTERYYGILKRRHHALFWLGFIFDTTGTTLMSIISHGFSLNIHAITGVIAIAVMFFHAVWATVALHKKDEKTLRGFHKYSLGYLAYPLLFGFCFKHTGHLKSSLKPNIEHPKMKIAF